MAPLALLAGISPAAFRHRLYGDETPRAQAPCKGTGYAKPPFLHYLPRYQGPRLRKLHPVTGTTGEGRWPFQGAVERGACRAVRLGRKRILPVGEPSAVVSQPEGDAEARYA